MSNTIVRKTVIVQEKDMEFAARDRKRLLGPDDEGGVQFFSKYVRRLIRDRRAQLKLEASTEAHPAKQA